MYRLHFESVGRDKRSWSHDVPVLDADAVAGHVAGKRALMSRDIEITLDMDTMSGAVYAGWRPVGTIRIEKLGSPN